jgi:hypothetical protein
MSEEKQQKDYEQNETHEVNTPREENQDEVKAETIFTGEEKKGEEKPPDEKPAFSESITYQPPTLAQLQDEANKRIFLIVLVVIGIIVLFLIGWLIWRAQTKDSVGVEKTPVPVRVGEGQALLSGTITYSGSKPKAGDQGEIGIYLRPANTQTEFADTGLRLSVQETTFNYVYAQTGVNYDVTAFLFYNGQQVAKSTITEAVAPTTDITLDFNVNWNQIINGWRAGNGTITGLVKIDGYFPAGSKVAIVEDMPTDWGISLEKIFVFEAAGVEMSYTIPNLEERGGI